MTDILAPDDPALQSMADLFKVFGDPTRVRILFALFQQAVCHLSSTPHLKASPPCQQPQRGKVHLLCPRRRPYLYHFPAGFGTYCRITSSSTPMDLCDSLKKSFLLSMENHLHFTRESAIIRAYRISLCEIWFPEVKQQWHIKSLMHVFLAVLVQTHVQ